MQITTADMDVASLPDLLITRAQRSATAPAYRQHDGERWVDITWGEVAREVGRWQEALRREGLKAGDRVAVSMRNRVEWVYFDQAALGLGLVVVPLFYNDRPDNMAWCLTDAGARLLLIEDGAVCTALAPQTPTLERVLCMGNAPTGDAKVRVVADWLPEGYVPAKRSTGMQTHADVKVRNAVRTPQFYLLWTVLFVNVTAGIGILEDAKPMIMDFFPNTVTEATATGFVGLLSLANMGGRFGWSTLSDRLGRQRTYVMYLGVGALLYATLSVVGSSSTALFVTLTFLIVSFYGGGFATIPAYLKDLFGKLEVGAIHGRLLTAWSAAGIAGPLIVNTIVDGRREAGVEGAELYIPSMVVMAALLVVGFVANALVRPVKATHHEPIDPLLAAEVEESLAAVELTPASPAAKES